ncbi:autotransporter domain-containing protein, partial [Roseiarcaceae bacterium H3SJ34-1]|uniref:autotransporter outer membrane beta-barrel domain-containing protein n=1 Tax=Terripilifer ovatus TaxID=3032367 RepID=UPI003AB925DA|nr:autotransporter domain-containing protein [Roseiarcaceae bacterium H3SJ34-1]
LDSAVSITAKGTVTGTSAEGIKTTGNGPVTVAVSGAVTGATTGLLLTGGIGGAGNILVTGTGGFVGGTGDAATIQNNGSGAVTVNISGASNSVGGHGIVVRDTVTGGNVSITTGAVTAMTAGKDAISAITQSLTANATVVANGDIKAGNAGVVTAILQGTATGNVSATANGAIDARFGVDAENFGSGTTTVTTVGAVTAKNGNGVFALSKGGNVSVTTGAVTSTGNTAIVARQSNAAGAGVIDVTANGAVSGTIGIEANNSGSGVVKITTNALVEGATSAIFARSAGQPILITSGGLVRNRSQLSTDLAIDASGGLVVFTNVGGMIGTVKFGAGANIFNNVANWNTAGGTNEFGGGASTLFNQPGVSIYTAVNGAAVETTTFNGLANFNNYGILTMADGGAGDRTTTSGNASFAAGSVYAVDVSGIDQSDRFIVNGTATLDAGSTLDVQGTLAYGAHYTVLTANGGVNGEFGSLTGDTSTAFLKVEDNYDANNVYLDVIKYRNFADAGLTRNQISTGRGLDTIPTVGPLFNAVAGLMTDTQARSAFDQLSGEQHASMSSVLVDDSRFVRSAAIDRLRSSFGSVGATPMPVMSYAAGGPARVPVSTERFVLWGQAFGSWGQLNGDGNAASVRRSTGGFTIGGDTLIFDSWRVGLLGGYSNTSFSISGRSSSGSSDNYHVSIYGGRQFGNLSLRTGAAYTWHDIKTNRSVAFPGFNDALSASYGARTAQVFGDLGYRIDMNSVSLEPFGSLAYVNLRTEGFRETGGPAALTSKGTTTGVTFTTLGLRASTDFAFGGMIATARGTLGWRHAFGSTTPVSTFAFAGGNAFNIAGVPIAQNAAVVEAGLDLRLFQDATFGVSYNGQFASSAGDQSVKANLAVKF